MNQDIRLLDYVLPGEKGLSAAAGRALADLKDGQTLKLGGGSLHFYADGTARHYYCISNNDKGHKQIVFPLLGKRDIIIDGEGAELIFHGEILPFAVDGCEHVTIRNLKVDYASPMYVQAQIVAAGKDYYELQFDQEQFHYRQRDGKIWISNDEDGWEQELRHCLTVEMDAKTQAPAPYKPEYITETESSTDNGFLSDLFHPMSYRDLGNGRLAVHGDAGFDYQVGNYWVGTFHYNRKNPGIFLHQSRDVTLRDIELYHTLAMGVIAQLCENVTLERVNTVPREGSGRLLSVCADSTHFVNCRGTIRVTGCKFTNMLDDAMNVHGIYHKILPDSGDYRLRLGVGHFQQVGILSYRPGDRIGIIDGISGACKGVYTVASAKMLSEEEILVETTEQLPQFHRQDVVENFSANPKVEVTHCECGNNRPRGFLISTWEKAVVENCTFYNMYEGILICGGVNDWYESGAVRDVTIRNNQFQNSAYAGNMAIHIMPAFGDMRQVKGFTSGIVIENNVFTQGDRRILRAWATQELVFRNNRFVQDPALPHHPQEGDDGVRFIDCEDVQYEAPKED